MIDFIRVNSYNSRHSRSVNGTRMPRIKRIFADMFLCKSVLKICVNL